MAIQTGFPQTSQDLIALHACTASTFPLSQTQPQNYFNVTHTHPNMLHTNLLVSPPTSITPSLPSLQKRLQKQDHEIDHYIKLQGEKLSMKLQEQGWQEVATLLNAMELNIINWMRQKDGEMALAVQRRMELEDLLNKVEAENEAWRRAAMESEAMMLSLSNSLEIMKQKAHYSSNNVCVDEAQSCWDENAKDDDEDEMIEREIKYCTCRCCKSGRSCFLLLPCRHLCVCKDCESFLQACPVCSMQKKAAIEAFIF